MGSIGKPVMSREPCPDRILDGIGEGFRMGSLGGSVFYFLKGIYNSPNGKRLIGGSQAVRMNAPRVGGNLAVWRGLFSICDCTMVYVRQKEDPWNFILAGAATRGLLHMRQGLGPASRSTLVGGCLFALFHGAVIMLEKLHHPPPLQKSFHLPCNMMPPPLQEQEVEEVAWFRGLFGGAEKKEKKKKSGGVSKTDLESFDSPSMPIRSFDI